jgi:hypothetical protein
MVVLSLHANDMDELRSSMHAVTCDIQHPASGSICRSRWSCRLHWPMQQPAAAGPPQSWTIAMMARLFRLIHLQRAAMFMCAASLTSDVAFALVHGGVLYRAEVETRTEGLRCYAAESP